MKPLTLTFPQALTFCRTEIKNRNQDCILVVVAGPSCSGKTTFAKQLAEQLETDGISVVVIPADDYFRDINDPALPQLNGYPLFDHPGSFHSDELLNDIADLVIHKKPVFKPIYNLSRNTRTGLTTELYPTNVVITEGLFTILEILKLGETIPNPICIYVDANYQTRLSRRVDRDRTMVNDEALIERIFKHVAEKSYAETGRSQINSADMIVYS